MNTDKLVEAIKDLQANGTSESYLNFLVVGSRLTRQGDGMLWSEVKEIIDRVIGK